MPDGATVGATGPEARRYRVGSLVYTRAALIQVMFWMLWGDFFFQLLESLPSIIPLQLRWEGAGDMLIGWSGSLSSFCMFCLSPLVAVRSDRWRGRLGRRRPFLLWCTPPVVLSLILLGLAKPSGAVVHRVLAALGQTQLTVASCTIAWLFLCAVLFMVFNTYIVQVYASMVVDAVNDNHPLPGDDSYTYPVAR